MTESSTDNPGFRDAEILQHPPEVAWPPFFNTPSRNGVLDQLEHLVQFGEGLPVLVGDAGSGKSCLFKALQHRLAGLDYCAFLEFTGETRLGPALSAILTYFDIAPSASAGELLSQLRHLSQSLAQEQMKAVMLLDNAHHLDDAAMGAMISLQQGNDNPGYGLQWVFSSRPGLVERLDALQLVDVPVYDFDVPLFSSSELADFLMSRTYLGETAGLVSKDDASRLWAQTHGNPGLAMRLLEGKESKAEAVTSRVHLASLRGLPLGHLVAMLVLIVVLVWAVMVREESTQEVLTQTVAIKPESSTAPAPAEKPAERDVSAPTLAQQSADKVALESPASQKPQTFRPSPSPQPPDVSGAAAGPPDLPTAQPVPADSQPELVSAPELAQGSGEVGVSTPVEALAPTFTSDEQTLLARPPGEFTLQVLAASKKESLLDYMDRQANRADLYLYQVNRNGRRLYVVLCGLYESKDAALLARNSLPFEQKKAGPWPRSITDIQREINENRRR